MENVDLKYFETEADIVPFRDHFQACFCESYSSLLSPTSVSQLLAGLQSGDIGGLLPRSDENVVFACIEGEIVGTAIWARRADTVYLWGFYVRQAQQRQKIGTALMNDIMQKQLEPVTFELTVLCASQDAISFYRQIGFEMASKAKFGFSPQQEFEAINMAVQSKIIKRVI